MHGRASPGGGEVSAAAIIGVGPGLGSALARRFAAGGFDLLLLNRSRPPMQAVVAELSRSSTRVDIRQVDVTDRSAVVAAMTAGAAQLGWCDTATAEGDARGGHVPARGSRRVRGQRPKARGLAVAEMPSGSTGM